MMRKQVAVLLAAALLAGCTRARPVTAPDGGQGYAIDCSGIQHQLADCYARATKACPSGYNVLSRDLTSSVLNPFQRSMLVSCRP